VEKNFRKGFASTSQQQKQQDMLYRNFSGANQGWARFKKKLGLEKFLAFLVFAVF